MARLGFLKFQDIEVHGQRVFLRLDLNVPIKEGKILDRNRIDAALPTVRLLLDRGARLVIASHLGRPKTEEDRQKLSLEPVAEYLSEVGLDVLFMETPDSEAPYELIKGLSSSQIILLENLRFAEGETKNSQELAAKWSRYTDIYINDAFGASHRAHASIDALARLIPTRCYGPLIEKELSALKTIKEDPRHPFVLITGGSKVSDKLPLLDALIDKVDSVLIGGGMAYTFLKVTGQSIGNSLLQKDQLALAEKFLARMKSQGKKVLLPIDHVVVDDFADPNDKGGVVDTIGVCQVAVDIGPKTQKLFVEEILKSGSVFWNGPMGVYERKPFNQGSVVIAEAMAASPAFSVIGGGDSAAAAIDSGFAGQINHISTGGGASLEYIQGMKMPGIEALRVRLPE